ncbi:hypothetical protein BC834DRAFT_842762 [Gloeopeniophorella convolvens]|nr:hypothetical protein BC834DRAFT_842762 [Gloeopeniophorella convolvens]
MASTMAPLKYRRKSSPPPSPVLSPIAPLSSSFLAPFAPSAVKWLDSDDELELEPALTSDDALTAHSSSCSRAPSLALDNEDADVDIVSSPVQETFFRAGSTSRASLPRYNKSAPDTKASATREDVAAALLALHAQPRLGPSRMAPAQAPAQTRTVEAQPAPARRSRVVSPSLRNLVLPRTPSPPPRLPFSMTAPPRLIDRTPVHGTAAPAQRSSPRDATPASSPLPPSSPLPEDDERDALDFDLSPQRRPVSPSRAPKREPTPDEACLPSGFSGPAASEAGEDAPRVGVAPLEASPVREGPPGARQEDLPCRDQRTPASAFALPPETPPPSISVSSPALISSNVAQAATSCAPDDRAGHGSRSSSPSSSALAPAPPAATAPIDLVLPDAPAPAPSSSRPASPALTVPDEPIAPPPASPVALRAAPSSPLSSPPSSPFPGQQCARSTSRKRSVPANEDDTEPEEEPEPAPRPRARTKRRRRDADADDKPWRDRKKHAPAPAPTRTRAPALPISPQRRRPPPVEDVEACPYPAILGPLLETLALSRASSLSLTALARTPSLSSHAPAALRATLAWAVRARVLGRVRCDAGADEWMYFYDADADPDAERGAVLRCLMPRAGKRRETMKYKQYYWAPVVVGRGRGARTWDVDWEE